MSGEARPDVTSVLGQLKDFQRRSTGYVFRRLYTDAQPTRRFLLADEVGLGKTLVARGVIARAIDHLWDREDRIDIVYVCSNGDIARQNIRRLNVTGQEEFTWPTRLTLLPKQLPDLTSRRLNFVSLTPGTSFDLRSATGTGPERALLYWMLKEPLGLQGTGPKNVLQDKMGRDRFRRLLKDFDPEVLDPGLIERFSRALETEHERASSEGRWSLRESFQALCDSFRRGRNYDRIPQELQNERRRVVGELRNLLAATCIDSLEPDLVVLDEFQRFRRLLSEEDEAGKLARHLFTFGTVRTLLLSATPYKMYTAGHEADEDHYSDFLNTADFLLNDADERTALEEDLRAYRRGLYRLADDGADAMKPVRRRLERRLHRVMCRTERLAASSDRSGMLRQVEDDPPRLTAADLEAYLGTQEIARTLDAGDATEYWKSAPYLLNFMERYQLKASLHRQQRHKSVVDALAQQEAAGRPVLLPWERVRGYQQIDPANPQLRRLEREMLDTGAWRLLWLPPSLPYYTSNGPFADPRLAGLTKRLIFSNWKVVPRAISALMSYEAERRMIRELDDAQQNTPEERRKHRGLLRITRDSDGRLTGMPVLGLLYPSFTLARLGDPLRLQTEGRHAGPPSLETVLQRVESEARDALAGLSNHTSATASEDERWYWAAPILLDQQEDTEAADWLAASDLGGRWIGWEEQVEDEAGSSWEEHVELARSVLRGERRLGRPPADLPRVLAEMAVGGPAVAALRALSRVCGGEAVLSDAELRDEAGGVGWAFRTLFNVPEVMALLRGSATDREPYWRRVLRYCVDGNLSSVLDEYAHVLLESLGLHDSPAGEAAATISETLGKAVALRPATPGVDEIRPNEDGTSVTLKSRPFRTRFALRFGDERTEEGGEQHRADQVRAAFNSPFWPFVLATTSIGQEGLDFHPYCHAVVHWNLPSNPVDLEQREGRVHRYKGHAIRRNLAQRHGHDLAINGQADPWEHLFRRAAVEPGRDSDLVPFWVYPQGDAKIDRHVPALPLSKEWARLPKLRRSLAIYRMVFGQPRQDDLLEYLMTRVPEQQLRRDLDRLRIDLTPPTPC